MHLTITGIDGPRELAEKTPLAIKLIREMPGPDRPDYWLGLLDSPINIGTENHERTVTHLIVSARWAATRIRSGARHLPLGIAYVTDASLLNDSSLDFAKCRYVAIGVGSDTSDRRSAERNLPWLLILYAAASLLHFAHNAEFLGQYPNLPSSWSRADIYIAWCGITILGVVGYLLCLRGKGAVGLTLLALYAILGFGGLLHYTRASIAHHSSMMNVTIWAEAIAGTLLLINVAIVAVRRAKPNAG
jgi:hypothetical protein